MPDLGSDTTRRRVMELVLAAAVAVALIGLTTGIAPTEYRALRPEPRPAADPGDIPPARTHAELEAQPWGGDPADSSWPRSLEIARAAEAATEQAAANEEGPIAEPLASVLESRARLRAYDGAPPVIPHPVRAGGAPECLACHGADFVLAGQRANDLPHESFASCTQCHVSAAPALALAGPGGPEVAPSRWSGLASPTGGATVWAGAPPAVPHATWMREACESCHGPEGSAALQTPHPERQSCLQCHPAVSEHGTPGAR